MPKPLYPTNICSECRYYAYGWAIDPKKDPEVDRPEARWCLLRLSFQQMDGRCPVGIKADEMKAIVVPQCANCGLVPWGKEPPPDWAYIEGAFGNWYWLCPTCQRH